MLVLNLKGAHKCYYCSWGAFILKANPQSTKTVVGFVDNKIYRYGAQIMLYLVNFL